MQCMHSGNFRMRNGWRRCQTRDLQSCRMRSSTVKTRTSLNLQAQSHGSAFQPLRHDGSVCNKRKRRGVSVSRKEQENLVDPVMLADPDSLFTEYHGIRIHYKMCDPQNAEARGIPAVLLHGFAASVFSWNQVMKPLATSVGSRMLAFDRPAFGLTARVSPAKNRPNPYSLEFAVNTTLSLVEKFEVPKVVLIGHSSGSLVALHAYFRAPERIAALVLVAPTIVAHKGFSSPCKKKLQFVKLIKNRLMNMLSGVFCSELGILMARFLVNKFGIEAIKYAWHDGKKVNDDVIQGYTKPLKCKGWERALLEFTFASIADSTGHRNPSLKEQLKSVSCPVLVITGDTDRVVPAWNAKCLAKDIPKSRFEVIENCGHIPQEEKPEEFVAVIKNFLQQI